MFVPTYKMASLPWDYRLTDKAVLDSAYTAEITREDLRYALDLPEILIHIGIMRIKPRFGVFVFGTDHPEGPLAKSLAAQVYKDFEIDTNAFGLPEDVDYVLILNDGDVLSPFAFYEYASFINANPRADVMYCDSDDQDMEGRRRNPFYKPAWSPDYLESFDYIGSGACLSGPLFRRFAPSATCIYDLLLKVTEHSNRVARLNKILCHKSLPRDPVARMGLDQSALQARLGRTGRAGNVEPTLHGRQYRFSFKIHLRRRPLVSVIIPTAGKTVTLKRRRIDLITNLVSILRRSTYREIEIIVVHNGDLGPRAEILKSLGCKMVSFDEPQFNVSRKVNLGFSRAEGELLLILNDDIEPVATDWIERMVAHFEKPHIGVVGAKLLYPDNTIQHCGIVLGTRGPEHCRPYQPANDDGYFFSTSGVRNFSAVTGAVMMTSAECFKAVNGFDDELAVNYNDADYCLKIRELGKSVLYEPAAVLTHFESASRKRSIETKEAEYFALKWWRAMLEDEFYDREKLRIEPAMFEPKLSPSRKSRDGQRFAGVRRDLVDLLGPCHSRQTEGPTGIPAFLTTAGGGLRPHRPAMRPSGIMERIDQADAI